MEFLVEYPTIPGDGYTSAICEDNRLSKLITKNRFSMLVSHLVIDATYNGEYLDKESINRLRDRPPLQRNTMYLYCKIAELYDADCKIIKDLLLNYNNMKPVEYALHNLSTTEKHYYTTIIPIRKDLIFNSGTNEVGWYNKRGNVLWISDIGHYKEKIVINLTDILVAIIEFKNRGYIPILPTLTIGCDPEFEILKGDKFVNADSILKDPNRDKEVGLDGYSHVGEIRPNFASNPITLARNIKKSVKKLLYTISDIDPDFKAQCGGGVWKGLGGHIHFNLDMPNNVNPLKHILYDLIGQHVKDSMDPKSARKTNTNYMDRDANEAFRRAEAHKGIEWRFLPSFILNEDTCKAILCTTWCVVKEYYGPGFPLPTYAPADVVNALRSLQYYPYYKKWVEKFITLFIENKTAMENKDLKKEWNINIPTNNLLIYSDIPWVQNYFVSSRVKLDRNIKIKILRVVDSMEFKMYGKKPISEELFTKLEKFAASHLTTFKYKTDANIDIDMLMYNPWDAPHDTKLAIEQFKDIVKNIIIEINKWR